MTPKILIAVKYNERANKIPMDTKTKDFQYRFIHDILSNKYWLHKWKVKESAECTYCNHHSESETIEHLFWSCDQSQLFWNGVSNVLLEARGPTQFTMEDVFIVKLYHFLCQYVPVQQEHPR
jgi:hypothetical protein